MVNPVVSERRLLSLSKTAYSNNRYKRLLVRLMFSPLIFQRLFLPYNMHNFSTL